MDEIKQLNNNIKKLEIGNKNLNKSIKDIDIFILDIFVYIEKLNFFKKIKFYFLFSAFYLDVLEIFLFRCGQL